MNTALGISEGLIAAKQNILSTARSAYERCEASSLEQKRPWRVSGRNRKHARHKITSVQKL